MAQWWGDDVPEACVWPGICSHQAFSVHRHIINILKKSFQAYKKKQVYSIYHFTRNPLFSCLVFKLMYRSNRSFNMPPPPGYTPGIWHFCRPGEEGIWLPGPSRGWGIWSPFFRGGEFELHPPFHVKSLAWRAIMGGAVLEDFRGKDCAFVANWLRGKA